MWLSHPGMSKAIILKGQVTSLSSSSLLLSSLELSRTQVYQPCVRDLLGTAAHSTRILHIALRPSFSRARSRALIALSLLSV